MEPQIISRPAFNVLGLQARARAGTQDAPGTWDALMPRAGEIPARGAAYGVIDNIDAAQGTFDYLAGFEVEGEPQPPPGMTLARIPAQTCAVFACTLPALMQAIHRANHVWLPASGYRRAAGPEFEEYGEAFDPGDTQSPMAISLPIEPA